MTTRSTKLLAVLLLLAGVSAVIAVVRVTDARGDADARSRDLERARGRLADLANSRSGALAGAPTSGKDPELNRRLRSAATAAGVPDLLSSVEPGQATRIRDTDYLETPVFVRLEAAPLRQLVALLAGLSADDRAIQVKSIELGPPPPGASGAAASSEERWTADLTLGYLVYSPRR